MGAEIWDRESLGKPWVHLCCGQNQHLPSVLLVGFSLARPWGLPCAAPEQRHLGWTLGFLLHQVYNSLRSFLFRLLSVPSEQIVLHFVLTYFDFIVLRRLVFLLRLPCSCTICGWGHCRQLQWLPCSGWKQEYRVLLGWQFSFSFCCCKAALGCGLHHSGKWNTGLNNR